MDDYVKNVLLITFVLNISWRYAESTTLDYKYQVRPDNVTLLDRFRRQTKGHTCITPTQPNHGQWTYLTNGRKGEANQESLEATVIKFSCDKGYKLSSSNHNSELISCASDGKWSVPEMPICQKLCPALYNTILTTLTCKIYGSIVPCDKATDNTILTYKCAPYYEKLVGRSDGIFCFDGSWDYMPECVPVCGEKRVSSTPLIINGRDVERGHYPWVVAIYSNKDNSKFTYICGGSLLKTNVVLTAAHCVTKNDGEISSISYYRVAAGKYYSKYEDPRDEDTAQYSDVTKIEISEEYRGEIQNFRGDVALLKLESELLLSKVVQSVCYKNLPDIVPGTKGLVSGWGFTTSSISSGKPSEVLQEIELPYVDERQCKSQLDSDFAQRYLIRDKLCAGFYNESKSVCKGDSGSGLVFRDLNGRFFIHGVVSLGYSYIENQEAQCGIQTHALFTKVYMYNDWIRFTLRIWEREMAKNKLPSITKCIAPPQPQHGQWTYLNHQVNQEIEVDTVIRFTCDQGYKLSSTNESQHIFCDSDGMWSVKDMPFCQKIQTSNDDKCRTPNGEETTCTGIYDCQPMLDVLRTLRQPFSAEIVKNLNSYKCPGQQRVCCPSEPILITQQSQQTDLSNHRNFHLLPKDCEYIESNFTSTNGNEASLNEFPFMALLQFRSGDDLLFAAAGTIINSRYILTVAHAIVTPSLDLISVRVGEHSITNKTDCGLLKDTEGTLKCNPPVQDLEIEESIIHPGYNRWRRINDIALLRVSKISYAENVSPVCLPVGKLGDSKLRGVFIAGWGHLDARSGEAADTLQKLGLSIMDQEECAAIYTKRNKTITNNHTCAIGADGRGLCIGYSGGPMLVPTFVDGKFFYVQHGIVSYGAPCREKAGFPDVLTKVKSYMNWILDNIKP